MKKLLLLLLLSQFSFGQITLTVSGTTYQVTGTELLTISNSYAQGFRACVSTTPPSCPTVVSYRRIFLDPGNYRNLITLSNNQQIIRSQSPIIGTQICAERECFYRYEVSRIRIVTTGTSTTTTNLPANNQYDWYGYIAYESGHRLSGFQTCGITTDSYGTCESTYTIVTSSTQICN